MFIPRIKENEDPNGVQNDQKAGPRQKKMTPPRPNVAKAIDTLPNKDQPDSTKVKPDMGEW